MRERLPFLNGADLDKARAKRRAYNRLGMGTLRRWRGPESGAGKGRSHTGGGRRQTAGLRRRAGAGQAGLGDRGRALSRGAGDAGPAVGGGDTPRGVLTGQRAVPEEELVVPARGAGLGAGPAAARSARVPGPRGWWGHGLTRESSW
ncbi:hypothetical protein GCM10023100_06530 [Actinocorallia cavernae]|uniref:Uncharacterized protein n=2 Tax=Actinomycetes TaxID=1760 RepID=A0ABN3N1E8_9ACTN